MIKLRSLRTNDCEKTFAWRNNPQIMKWCRQHDLLECEGHVDWITTLHLDKSKKMYGITCSETLIGVCGLTSIDLINQRAEFSLYIAPEYQAQGFATITLVQLFQIGFERYPLNIIYGETFDNNPACKLFEKLGMIKEGTRRDFYFKEGKFIDAHLYSIKRSEFVK